MILLNSPSKACFGPSRRGLSNGAPRRAHPSLSRGREFIPDREGEVAVQPVEAAFAKIGEEVEENFGIGMRPENLDLTIAFCRRLRLVVDRRRTRASRGRSLARRQRQHPCPTHELTIARDVLRSAAGLSAQRRWPAHPLQRLEFRPKLDMVEDFDDEGDGQPAIGAGHRLGALREIADREPAMGQAGARKDAHTRAVRTAMRDRIGRAC
jgi:hypothetical protein